MKSVECFICNEIVPYDESGEDEAGNDLCRDCYEEKTFHCAFCEESEWEEYQHEMLIVFDADESGVTTGVYKILKHPYYAQPVVGSGDLYEWAIEKISELPPDAPKDYDYPCGHLCRECRKKFIVDHETVDQN